MAPRSLIDIHNIRLSIDRIGNISDSIINLGPVKFGLDGILEMVPFAGEIYSVVSGVMLVIEGMRAKLPFTVIASTVVLIGLRTLIGSVDVLAIPIAGPLATIIGAVPNLVSAGFRAHRMAADMMIRAIDETCYVEMSRAEARRNPDYESLVARVRAGQEHRRVVFLG